MVDIVVTILEAVDFITSGTALCVPKTVFEFRKLCSIMLSEMCEIM